MSSTLLPEKLPWGLLALGNRNVFEQWPPYITWTSHYVWQIRTKIPQAREPSTVIIYYPNWQYNKSPIFVPRTPPCLAWENEIPNLRNFIGCYVAPDQTESVILIRVCINLQFQRLPSMLVLRVVQNICSNNDHELAISYLHFITGTLYIGEQHFGGTGRSMLIRWPQSRTLLQLTRGTNSGPLRPTCWPHDCHGRACTNLSGNIMGLLVVVKIHVTWRMLVLNSYIKSP